MNHYVQGELVRVWGRFKNFQGALTDPTTISILVRTPEPNGATTTYTFAGGQVLKLETGVYYYDVDTSSKSGVWSYRVVGTGALQAAGQGQFTADAAFPT